MHRINILYTPIFVTVLMATVIAVAIVSVFAFGADRLVSVAMSLVAIGIIWTLSSFIYMGVGCYNLWASEEPQLVDWASIAWGLSGAIPLVVNWAVADSSPHFVTEGQL